jgi:hypothetical protein
MAELGELVVAIHGFRGRPEIGAHDRHAQGAAHPGDLGPDASEAHDRQGASREVGARVPLPVPALLGLEQAPPALVVQQERHHHELGQGSPVHPAGRGEDGLWHALVVAVDLHELPDPGAGGLDPAGARGQLRQVGAMRRIEVEEDIRLGEQPPPALLLLRCPLEVAAVWRRSAAGSSAGS